jgi:hypothetical protein
MRMNQLTSGGLLQFPGSIFWQLRNKRIQTLHIYITIAINAQFSTVFKACEVCALKFPAEMSLGDLNFNYNVRYGYAVSVFRTNLPSLGNVEQASIGRRHFEIKNNLTFKAR